jgi:predicted nucleic acid-binding protein
MAESAIVVVDASTMVDLLLNTERSDQIRTSLRERSLVAPAHFDVEVMSALGRLERSGAISEEGASTRIDRLASAPIRREPLAPLLSGAWARRGDTRLTDALYVELAAALDTVVVTTDLRLARAHPALTHVPAAPT